MSIESVPRVDARVEEVDLRQLAASEGVLDDFLAEIVTVPQDAPQEVREFYAGGYDFETLTPAAQDYIESIDPGWGVSVDAAAWTPDEASI